MPVVSMHDIRTPERIQPAGHLATYPTQQRKTQHVVGVSMLVSIVVRAPWAVVEMRGINQIDPHAVIVTKQQRHASGKSIPPRHHLRIGDATANVRERRQQHARINTFSDLRRR